MWWVCQRPPAAVLKGECFGSLEQGVPLEIMQVVDPRKKCSNRNSSSAEAAGFSAPLSHLVIIPLIANAALLKKMAPVCFSEDVLALYFVWEDRLLAVMHVGKLSSALAI